MKKIRHHAPAFLIVLGMSLCFFGPQYEISRIPAPTRAKMGDFDWIGVEWIVRGTVVIIAGAVWWSVRYLHRRPDEGPTTNDQIST